MKTGPRAALIALAIFAGPVASDAATFRVATDRTSVAFAVSNFGIGSHEGRFDLTSGKIVLDPERRSGSIEFVVDVGSVDTGWELRDTFLKSDLMFDVQRYPSIRFRSTRLAFEGPRLVAVDGEMTLHGVTLPVRFDVTRMECGADTGVGARRLRSVGARAHLAQRVRDVVRLSAGRRRGCARFLDQGDSRPRRWREGIRHGDQRGRTDRKMTASGPLMRRPASRAPR